MINKLKQWLYNRFLPSWCREELLADNKRLLEANYSQKIEIGRLNAYIDGLEMAVRSRNKIIINNEVPK